MSFLLTLTKKAKNRRIKRNSIKNIFRAALSRAGYCLGHGLGLHLLLRQFHLPSFPDSIGHKFALPVSPAASSQRHRPAPETVFPPEPSPKKWQQKTPDFREGKLARPINFPILRITVSSLNESKEHGKRNNSHHQQQTKNADCS